MVCFHVCLLWILQESAVHCYSHCVHASILHGAFLQNLPPNGMCHVQFRHTTVIKLNSSGEAHAWGMLEGGCLHVQCTCTCKCLHFLRACTCTLINGNLSLIGFVKCFRY